MRVFAIAVIGIVLLASCGVGDDADGESVTLRLGYFPNVTHAPAIVGVEDGILADALGSGVVLEPHVFNAGPEVVEAIFNGALDASFIGPNPAINAFAQSDGQGDPHRVGHDLGRRRPHRARRHHVPRPAGRHRPRDAAARQHAGRRLAGLAARAGLRDRPRRRGRRVHHSAGERGRVDCVHRRRHRRRLGPRAVVDAHGRGGRGPGPRQRGRPVAGRRVRDHPPHRRDRIPRGAPGRRQRAGRGQPRGDRLHE